MEGEVSDECVYCTKPCGWREQALQCDVCSRWQHRKCHTGISQTFYRRLNKGLEVLEDWRCHACSLTSSIAVSSDPGNTARGILDDSSLSSSPCTSSRGQTPQTADDWPTPPPAIRTPDFRWSSSSDENWPTSRRVNPTAVIRSRTLSSPSSSENDWPTPPGAVHTPSCRFRLDSSGDDGSYRTLDLARLRLDDFSDLSDDDTDTSPVTYTVIEEGTQKGSPRLVDSWGYSYTKKKVTKNYIYWACPVRGKNHTCHALIKQAGTTFTSSNSHNHAGKPGLYATSILSIKIKKAVEEAPGRPVQQIVREHYNMPENKDLILPPMTNMTKNASRHRNKQLALRK